MKPATFCGESSLGHFSSSLLSNILQPWLFGRTKINGKLFGEVWGDLMSALFLTITITQHFPQLQKDWSKSWSIRGRIAVDSQHQICIPAKFLFLYSSWNRFTKEWENIFADYQISGLSSEVWHFVTKIGQKSNHHGQNSPKLGKTPSRSRTAN